MLGWQAPSMLMLDPESATVWKLLVSACRAEKVGRGRMLPWIRVYFFSYSLFSTTQPLKLIERPEKEDSFSLYYQLYFFP